MKSRTKSSPKSLWSCTTITSHDVTIHVDKLSQRTVMNEQNRHCQAMNFQTGEKWLTIFWQSKNRFSIIYFIKRDWLFIFTLSEIAQLGVRRLGVVLRYTEKNTYAESILLIALNIDKFLITHFETMFSIVNSLKKNTNIPPSRLMITTLLLYIGSNYVRHTAIILDNKVA